MQTQGNKLSEITLLSSARRCLKFHRKHILTYAIRSSLVVHRTWNKQWWEKCRIM